MYRHASYMSRSYTCRSGDRDPDAMRLTVSDISVHEIGLSTSRSTSEKYILSHRQYVESLILIHDGSIWKRRGKKNWISNNFSYTRTAPSPTMELGVILNPLYYEETPFEMACILRYRASHLLSRSDRSDSEKTSSQVPITEKDPYRGLFLWSYF